MNTATTPLESHLRYGIDHYTSAPTVEEGHGKACLANAALAAVQNYRDDADVSQSEFSTFLRSGEVFDVAWSYITSELSDCMCAPKVREESRYYTIAYRIDSGRTLRYEVYGTLTDTVATADDLRATMPNISSVAVGWDADGQLSGHSLAWVWMSADWGRDNGFARVTAGIN